MGRLFRSGIKFDDFYDALSTDQLADDQWARDLVDAAKRVFDDYDGLAVNVVRHDAATAATEMVVAAHGLMPLQLESYPLVAKTLGPAAVRQLYYPRTVLASPEQLVQSSPMPVPEVYRVLGLRPMSVCGMIGHDDVSYSGVLCWTRRDPMQPHDRRIAFQAALRFDAAVRSRSAGLVEGVLSPEGVLLEGGADLAPLWLALHSGRVSLFERSRAGARHYDLIANAPSHRAARALSREEREALEGAATGVLGKQQALATLVAETTLSRQLADGAAKLGVRSVSDAIRLVAGLVYPDAAPLSGELTATEEDVLMLVRDGMTNAEIAAQRGRSVRTVANQVASILRKTKSPSRRTLAARRFLRTA